MALFNIRVYGILIDQEKGLLVSDEFIRGNFITKLPGGGLEFGEGTRECLAREFKEETGQSVLVGNHFYTTDFFQISAFNHQDQIVSIYYWVSPETDFQITSSQIPFNFLPEQIANPSIEAEVFRWIPLNELSKTSLTLPIDQLVIEKLLESIPKNSNS